MDSAWRAGTFAPPNGEHWSDFTSQTSAMVLSAFEDADRLLVVCHGGVIRALLQLLLGLAPKSIIPVGPGSLTVIASKDTGIDMRLEVFNFAPGGLVLDAPD